MTGNDQGDLPDLEGMDALAIGVSGAMARQYAQDARGFLSQLARFLTSALGEDAVVVKRAGLFGGDARPVKRIEFTLSAEGGARATRYSIKDAGGGRGGVTATRAQIVHNVALKTEPMPVQQWIEAVGTALAAEAERGRAARDALRDLL